MNRCIACGVSYVESANTAGRAVPDRGACEHVQSRHRPDRELPRRPAGGPLAYVLFAIQVNTPSPSMGDLARRLVAASQLASRSDARAAGLVNDNLRVCVIRFAGADGFASLLRRAVTLAAAQMSAVRGANVGSDVRIEDVEEILTGQESALQESAFAITAQLLELLVTFIGEPLTRRLVREACPEISPEE